MRRLPERAWSRSSSWASGPATPGDAGAVAAPRHRPLVVDRRPVVGPARAAPAPDWQRGPHRLDPRVRVPGEESRRRSPALATGPQRPGRARGTGPWSGLIVRMTPGEALVGLRRLRWAACGRLIAVSAGPASGPRARSRPAGRRAKSTRKSGAVGYQTRRVRPGPDGRSRETLNRCAAEAGGVPAPYVHRFCGLRRLKTRCEPRLEGRSDGPSRTKVARSGHPAVGRLSGRSGWHRRSPDCRRRRRCGRPARGRPVSGRGGRG